MRINQRDNTLYRNPQSLHDEEIANNEIDDAIDSSIAARVNGYEDGVLDNRLKDYHPRHGHSSDEYDAYIEGLRKGRGNEDMWSLRNEEEYDDLMYDILHDENASSEEVKRAKAYITSKNVRDRLNHFRTNDLKIKHDANRPWGKIKNNPHFPDEDEEEAPKTEEQKMIEKLYVIMQLGENITDQTYSAIDNLKRYYNDGTPESKIGYEKDIDFIINYFKTGLADARFFKNYFIDDYLD